MSTKSRTKVFGLSNETKDIKATDLNDYITIDEASKFLKLEKSYLYKLVSDRKIPFYKPFGKILYFNIIELNQLIKNSRSLTSDEYAEKLKKRSN